MRQIDVSTGRLEWERRSFSFIARIFQLPARMIVGFAGDDADVRSTRTISMAFGWGWDDGCLSKVARWWCGKEREGESRLSVMPSASWADVAIA